MSHAVAAPNSNPSTWEIVKAMGRRMQREEKVGSTLLLSALAVASAALAAFCMTKAIKYVAGEHAKLAKGNWVVNTYRDHFPIPIHTRPFSRWDVAASYKWLIPAGLMNIFPAAFTYELVGDLRELYRQAKEDLAASAR